MESNSNNNKHTMENFAKIKRRKEKQTQTYYGTISNRGSAYFVST